MTDELTMVRVGVTSFFCFTTLGIAWCLTPANSFADAPLIENHSVIVPPAIGMVLESETKRDKLIARSPMPPGGRHACLSIDERIEDRLGPRGFESDQTLMFPLTTVCMGLFPAADETGWPGYEATGDHAKSLGNWAEAERAYATAVGLLDRVMDKEGNQDLAALLTKLGVARFKQNDFAGAEVVFRRALTIYTSTRGAEDLRVADTLDLVASALFEQQQGRALAGPLFFRAWVIRETSLGPDHPAIADSLHHVAVSLYSDNVSLAIPLFLRSREIREKVFGHDHPLVADSLNAMAKLYDLHNRRDLAIPLYQDALSIQEKVFGPNASETLQVRSSLGTAREK